jgi:hypothetical protein
MPSGPPVVVQSWQVSRFSFFGSIGPAYNLLFGTAVVVLGAYLVISNWGESAWLGYLWLVFIGCLAIGFGIFYFEYVVRRVDALNNGQYRFASRKRSLVVEPKNIKSLKGLGYVMDPWGMYPFRMKAGAGNMFVDRHMRSGGGLEFELRRANPRMKVFRAWGSDDPDAAPWKDEDVWEP